MDKEENKNGLNKGKSKNPLGPRASSGSDAANMALDKELDDLGFSLGAAADLRSESVESKELEEVSLTENEMRSRDLIRRDSQADNRARVESKNQARGDGSQHGSIPGQSVSPDPNDGVAIIKKATHLKLYNGIYFSNKSM